MKKSVWNSGPCIYKMGYNMSRSTNIQKYFILRLRKFPYLFHGYLWIWYSLSTTSQTRKLSKDMRKTKARVIFLCPLDILWFSVEKLGKMQMFQVVNDFLVI